MSILVVLPTFNRSNVLRLAIDSILAQTATDWRLLVIGDACTDDSEQVVQRLQAEHPTRAIEWINRAHNFGNMALPINEATELGLQRWPMCRFIALCSHDDLWMPQHLQDLSTLLEQGADFAASAYFEHVQSFDSAPQAGSLCLRHVSPAAYSPFLAPLTMSAWMYRVSLWRKVGGWRPPAQLYESPSNNWRFRAWYAGARMALSAMPSLIVVNSVLRAQSYLARSDHEQRYWHARLGCSDLMDQLKACLAPHHAASAPRLEASKAMFAVRLWRSLSYRLRNAPRQILRRIAPRFGISPFAVDRWWQGEQRGDFVAELMHLRGLRELKSTQQDE
jgi:glycosyltransferase involved in cell wall biosynthesis